MVVAEAERTVQQMNRLSDTVRHVAGGGSTVLRLGYVGTSVLESLIVSAIKTFRSSFPDVLPEASELSVAEQFCLLPVCADYFAFYVWWRGDNRRLNPA